MLNLNHLYRFFLVQPIKTVTSPEGPTFTVSMIVSPMVGESRHLEMQGTGLAWWKTFSPGSDLTWPLLALTYI